MRWRWVSGDRHATASWFETRGIAALLTMGGRPILMEDEQAGQLMQF